MIHPRRSPLGYHHHHAMTEVLNCVVLPFLKREAVLESPGGVNETLRCLGEL